MCVLLSARYLTDAFLHGVNQTWYAWVMVYPIEVIDFGIDLSDVDPGLLFHFS